MSLAPFVDEVEQGVAWLPARMPRRQALVYAIENIVERHLPTQVIARREAVEWLDAVCDAECWDTPHVEAIRSRKWAGVACRESNVIGISSGKTTAMTLAHELAHLVCGTDTHDKCWRSSLVHIVRNHISVQHASFLHALYNRFGLEVDRWETSRD